MKLRNSAACSVIIQLLILVVNGQKCVDKVGSLAHDDVRVLADYTFIFTDSEYTVACEGTVIAWEFCYRTQRNTTVMTFYPGIWIPTETGYTLVQSSTVTYTTPQVGDGNNNVLCQTFNLSEADQFTAPAGSVVGLYSNITRLQSFLLRTERTNMPSLTSYRFPGNHSIVNATNGNTRYSIALRVHLAQCPAPTNGKVHCPKGHRGDTCTFFCNPGYELQGSNNGTCLANLSWSGGDPKCVALNCSTSPPLNNSQLQSSCDTQYQSTCTTVCVDGYTGVGGSYTCVVTDEDTNSVGWNGSTSCQRVPCVSLSDPDNGNVTCPSNTSVFQDTCTYYCNRGYQLEGNRQTRCRADGTWSSEPVTCTILKCNDPEVEIANSQSVGVCNMTYGSSCALNCSSGFSVSGNGEHVCDDVNDEGTSVKWRGTGGAFSCVDAEAAINSNSSNGSTIPIIVGSVGGAVLFFTIVLCVVILCVRISHKKKSHMCDNGKVDVIETELNLDINMTVNPSYVTKDSKKQEDQYDYILNNKFALQDEMQDTLMIDFDPTSERTQSSNAAISYVITEPGHDLTIQSNPLYSSSLMETMRTPGDGDEDEDEDGYVKTNSLNTQTTGYLKIIGPVVKIEESVYEKN